MFPKLPTHLRPFLGRIPSHTSPDLFTPNPSLLHHLPQNGSGSHTLVSQAQSSAQAAGSGGSAGRAGYSGGSAGSGGGYTGHARAFASLQHSAADPSSGVNSNDDTNSRRNRDRKRRESISFRPPYQRNITIVDETSSQIQSLSLKDSIKSLRSGDGRTLRTVELDVVSSTPTPAVGWRELADTTWTQNQLREGATQDTSFSALDGGRPPLTRSRSTLELYQVGVPSRPNLSVRQYATAASPAISELDIDEYHLPLSSASVSRTTSLPPVQRKLSQPNRVLMDLAGLDIPSRPRSSGRNYATTTTATTDEDVDYTPADTEDNEMDRRIYTAIQHAVQTQRKDLVKQLIEYYRSPRDQIPSSNNSDLESHLPLPAGYTVNTYNACIRALISLRSSGESIAPILELYNEMLSRDVVPNGKTYADVICALCARDKDVQAAVAQRGEEKKWNDFRSRNLGLELKHENENDHGKEEEDATLQGYLNEGNLTSAFRLFKGIASVQSQTNSFYRFYPVVYNYLLDAIATQSQPDVERALEVFDHAHQTETAGRRMLYKHLFRVYAGANDQSGVLGLWEKFEDERLQGGLGTKLREWKDIPPGMEIDDREVQVERFQSEVWTSALVALIQTGSTDRAIEVLESMMARMGQNERSVALSKPPRPTEETFGAVVIALAQAGHAGLSKEWFDKALQAGKVFRPMDIARYVDALVVDGQWKTALDVYYPIVENAPEGVRVDHTRVKRIYGAILGSARQSSSLKKEDEVMAKLEHANRLMSATREAVVIEPELVMQHIGLLLASPSSSSTPKYSAIAPVLDRFGPLVSKYRIEKEDRRPLHDLLSQIATTDIGLLDMLDVIRAFSRQRVQPNTDRPKLLTSILHKYTSFRSSAEGVKQISPDGWSKLLMVAARTGGRSLNEGEYDYALEALFEDLAVYAPETLRSSSEGRIVRALAERLFNRFGSERASAMLAPLIGEEATSTTLAPMFESTESSIILPSTPELGSSESEQASSSSRAAPTTPSSDTLPPPPTAPPTGKARSARIRIDPDLTRLIESTFDRQPQLTPSSAYDEIRKSLAAQNIAPHPGSIAKLMTSFARDGPLQNEPRVLELYQLAQTIISSSPPHPHSQSQQWRLVEDGMLISQCHLGHLEQAGLHRHRLVQNGTPPSADAYATMIASSKDTTDDALVARELFDESQALGVKPNLYLYNTVISKLSKARKAESALEMFAQMKAQRVKPSSVTYGAVINACCRVGDAESAETLFQEMSSQPNFRPRVPPFNTMMQFYLQTRPNRERVLHYYSALRQSGVPPSAHTYKLLLDAYHTLPPLDLTAMERTFAELCSDRSVRVGGTHWASLITAYGISARDVPKALEVFEVIPTHPSNRGVGVGVDALTEPVVWEAILNVVASNGSVEQMESIRSKMIPKARPTAYVYNVLISGYARHGQIHRAREVFESMADSFTGVSAPNNHPTLHTSSGHIKPSTSVTGEGNGVVYREPSTYESMIRAEMAAGDFARAEEVLARMEERGYPLAVYLKARSLVEGTLGAGVGMNHGALVFAPFEGGAGAVQVTVEGNA